MFSPMNHQLFVRDYLNITTPYRGLLLYHGLGSGKTCTSIGIIEGFKHDKAYLYFNTRFSTTKLCKSDAVLRRQNI